MFEREKKPKELGKRRVFSEKGSFLVCSNFPTTTTTFFGLSGDCCNKNCSKRFYLYTHKNKKKKIYSDKNRHRQPDCKLQPSFCTRFVHIFLNCFSLSILNLLKKVQLKKRIYLLYTYPIHVYLRGSAALIVFYCRMNAAAAKS